MSIIRSMVLLFVRGHGRFRTKFHPTEINLIHPLVVGKLIILNVGPNNVITKDVKKSLYFCCARPLGLLNKGVFFYINKQMLFLILNFLTLYYGIYKENCKKVLYVNQLLSRYATIFSSNVTICFICLSVRPSVSPSVRNAVGSNCRKRGQWAVYYTSPQSLMITISYSLA